MVTVPLGPFLGGLALLCAVLAAASFAGGVARRRWLPTLAGLEAFLAAALLATLALALVHVVPLALGVLSKGTVLVAAVLLAAAAFAVWLGLSPRPLAPEPCPERDVVVARAVAWGAGLLVAGAAVAFLRRYGPEPTLSSDALNFHVPQVARWVQTGSMWQLDQFYPLYSNATYPHHGNVLLLATVLPFDSTFLVRWVPVPFAVLTCIAIFAAGRELGARAGWAALAATLLAALPIFVKVALDGTQTDTPLTFGFAVALLFLLRHRRTRARADLVVAGLAVGLAAATKWYAYSQIPPMVAVWAVAGLIAGRSPKRVLGDTALLAAVAALVAAPWLVRNLVEAGNPLFPQPLGPFDGPRDVIREQAGFALSHYITDFDVWSTYLRPQFDQFFAGPGYLLFAASVFGLVVAVRRRAPAPAALAIAALLGIACYALTPFSAFGAEGMPVLAFANTRYGLPALLAGAVLLGWAGTQLGPRAGAIGAALTGLVVLEGAHEQYRPELGYGVIGAGALAAGVAAYAIPRVRARTMAVLGAAGLLAGAFALRDDYDLTPYAVTEPALAYLQEEAPEGHRVALAGVWSPSGVSPVLPAFGPRLGNDVAFLGPFREHLLRPETDPARFRERLRGYDLLVVGRGIAPTGAPVREEAWARRAGFEPVVASDRLALLRRVGAPTS